MTKNDFKSQLDNLEPGQAVTLNYEMFDLAFPPGVEDDHAKEAAYHYAKAQGCVIRYRASRREVSFVKDPAPST